MPKYKKKSESLDAFQWDGEAPNSPSNPSWVKVLAAQGDAATKPDVLIVKTQKGSSKVFIDDWLVQDDDGNVSVIPDSIFSDEYEEDTE